VAADRIDIKVTADTREATANLARFSASAKAAAESAGRIAAGVAGGIAAIGAGAYKIAEFAAAVEQQEMAINRLGPAYEAVRAATAGVVTAQEALKTQQTLVQAGLRVSSQQLATITRAAREYSRATGTELTQSLEQLTDALRTGSGEGLGRFGVSLEQGVTGARAFGSALEQLTTQQQNTAVSARSMSEDLAKLPEGLTEIGRAALAAAEGPLDSLMRAITGVVGASTGLRGVLSELASAGDTLRQRERQEATDRAGMERLAAREALTQRARIAGVQLTQTQTQGLSAEQLRRLQTAVDRAAGTTGMTGAAAAIMGAQRRGLFGAMERQSQVDQVLEQLRNEADAQAGRTGLRIVQAPARRAGGARVGGGGGGARAAPRPQGPRSVDELFASLFGERSLSDAFDDAEVRLRGLMANTIGAVADPSVFDEILAASGTAQGAQAGERVQSFGERVLRAAGLSVDDDGRTPALDAAQSGVEMLGQALPALQAGFANLFNTLASGSLSAGEAFKQFAAKTLSSLGEMAVNKGVFYTFEGIASLFTNPVAAPGYLVAGAGLIALGAGLGAAGAAVAPTAPAGGSSAPAAARSASGASPRSDGGGAGNVTIVLSSLVPPGPRELQGLVNAQRQAGRYGIDRDRMVPRQVRA
jgi:hypothetical protein